MLGKSKGKGPGKTLNPADEKYLDILISGGIRPEDLPEDLKGNPVHIPQVNFTVPLEQQVRSKSGPPPYAVRAKLVEDLTEALHAELREKRRMIAQSLGPDPHRFARVWRAVVETLDLRELNLLIAEHNRFYPIEANLKADADTGQIMIGNTPWKPKAKLTPEKLLDLFPPDLEAAAGP